mmetsp:Transcript_44629/g.43269  ORF Transcript_44629/g.43269 Transcript_44629/m.43269 type:complete len:130 (+) Transcript_44629:96-485(+)
MDLKEAGIDLHPMVKEKLKILGSFNFEVNYFPYVDQELYCEWREITVLPNNQYYLGQWNKMNSLRDGMGKQIWADGRFYEGFWKNDKPEGKGRLIHPDGEVYEGEWLKGKAHGRGSYYHKNGTIFKGQL